MSLGTKTADDVLKLAKERGVVAVDLRLMDFIGRWQHFTIPTSELKASLFEDGVGFDGSSLRGWQSIHESDMLVVPDPTTAFIDPFFKHPTLVLICDVQDPITRSNYSRDPRNVARKAEQYLKRSGVADAAYIGPEAEFFIFDRVSYYHKPQAAGYTIDSEEAHWRAGDPGHEDHPNLGHKIRAKEGYFPVPPVDSLQDLRTEMVLELEKCGIPVECQHHEVATAGQAEIDLVLDSLLRMADKLAVYKYVLKSVAQRHNKCVTFMPKPIFGDNGSGMHTHLSLWKDDVNLFAGSGYAGLSETGLYAVGGVLKHAASLIAFTNPTTNSFKRLTPGFEAPINLAYSARNRSAALRVPMFSTNPKTKRFEFRCPDPSCNQYLAFSALMMAALDGVQNKIHPGEPLDKDIYDLPPEELAKVPQTPGSLEEALAALKDDYEYLLKGEVFTEDVIEMWTAYKKAEEADQVRLRPHPQEFVLYFDV